jgi:hypothetical protein
MCTPTAAAGCTRNSSISKENGLNGEILACPLTHTPANLDETSAGVPKPRRLADHIFEGYPTKTRDWQVPHNQLSFRSIHSTAWEGAMAH